MRCSKENHGVSQFSIKEKSKETLPFLFWSEHGKIEKDQSQIKSQYCKIF